MPKKQATSSTLAMLVFCCLAGPLNAQQKPEEATTDAILGRGAVGMDKNIESSLDNVRAVADTMSAPPAERGVRTRGGGEWCTMRVSNASSLHANVYVDGKFWGTTPAFGDLFAWMRCRDIRLYARANFDDGASYYYWGPTTVSLKGNYTWRISRRH